MDLDKIRIKIDKEDMALTRAFENRMELVLKISKYKIANDIAIFDSNREEKVLDKAESRITNPQIKPYIRSFYKGTIGVSRQMQRDLISSYNHGKTMIDKTEGQTYGYLGIPGSFSDIAVVEMFGDDVLSFGAKDFHELVLGVENGKFTSAVIPIENSYTGDLASVIDLFVEHDVFMYREHKIRIHHNLLGLEGSETSKITHVYSHPQGISQCSDFLREHNITATPAKSTAHAAKMVKEQGDPTIGSISSLRAAQLHGLDVLSKDIETVSNNYTRFAVIKSEIDISPSADKTSICCYLDHRPGSLYAMLGIFEKHQVNLLKLASRPIPEQPWHYSFHLDFSGNLNDKNIQNLLTNLKDMCSYIKIIGCYPTWSE